jgi:hypothetical protein
MESWRESQGAREFGWGELGRLTGVNLPSLHRIRDRQGEPDQRTLDRIAEGLGVPAPTRQTVLRFAPRPKTTALDWVERARLALDMASSIMRQPTASTTIQRMLGDGTVVGEARRAEEEAGAGDTAGDQQQPRPA